MNKESLVECDQMIEQLDNIIRAASIYGRDVSYYRNEIKKWEDKKHDILSGTYNLKGELI